MITKTSRRECVYTCTHALLKHLTPNNTMQAHLQLCIKVEHTCSPINHIFVNVHV